MKRSIIFWLILLSSCLMAEGTVYYNAVPFLEGKGFPSESADYERLPQDAQNIVRKPVWGLARNSAGIVAHFWTDSPEISAKWVLLNHFKMNHMATTGIGGLDLYVKHEGHWQHIATGKPYKKENTRTLIKNMSREKREYLLYCPTYDGLDDLQIGVSDGALMEKVQRTSLPLVFYGTSITQSGCASRSGMGYPAILGRRLERESINLGFSGNGRMDKNVMEYISQIPASCYILDNLPNMSMAMIDSLAEDGIELLLSAHPKTPVLLLENCPPPAGIVDTVEQATMNAENAKLKSIYRRLKKSHRNLYYCSSKDMKNVSVNGTVDGVHLTDYGFVKMADVLEGKIGRLLKR